MIKCTQIVFFVLLYALTGSAKIAERGLYYDQSIQGSYNPLGLQSYSKLFYRLPLCDKNGGMLWESTKVDLGIQNNLSPAYDLFGLYFNIEPVAFFDLAITAQFAGYFKAFGFGFQDLLNYNSAYDDDNIDTNSNRNAIGTVITVSPTLKFAYSIISALNTFSVVYHHVDNGKGYFYERIGNVALAKNDIELFNQAYLLATVYEGLMIGANDSIVYVPNSGYLSHRLSGIATYSTNLTDNLSIYSALLMGTFLEDKYEQYKLYIDGQVGITLKI